MGTVLAFSAGFGILLYLLLKNKGLEKITIKPLTVDQEKLIEKYFPIYNKLHPDQKQIFKSRVAYFISKKQFIPRNMPVVTDEMKTLISATAVQLTLGLPKVYLQHFRYILVYPDHYYSTITRLYHKGEVNPRHQAIVLSWRSFTEGYATNDGINLAFHEMAHALKLENRIRNEEFDFLPKEELESWDILSKEEMNKMLDENYTPFFRNYGRVDLDEFFAVAVENLFDRPEEFSEKKPELYFLLTKILNQDPLKL